MVYSARSAEGLWVRSTLDLTKGVISFEWLTRHRKIGMFVETLDCNGDVMDRDHVMWARWDHGWVHAGEVSLDRMELIQMVDKNHLRQLYEGIMIHGVELIALGWGESAADVVSWLHEPWKGEFIVDTKYSAKEGVGEFDGLHDIDVVVESWEEGVLKGEMVVQDKESFPLETSSSTIPADFLRSMVPKE
jgi:hypothetical protein